MNRGYTDLQRLRTLSLQQFSVMMEVADGAPYKAVADMLGISHKTVGAYMQVIYRKTGTDCAATLTQFAIRVGVMAP